jgi:hypothetical protein
VATGGAGPLCAGIVSAAITGITGGDLGDALRARIIAFITAQAFAFVGNQTGHGTLDFLSPKHLANVGGHALVGCASAIAQGGKCGPGALSAAVGSLAGPAVGNQFPNPDTNPGHPIGGTVASAVVGGVASVAAGGKFANGAITAAFGYLFNQAMKHTYDAQVTTDALHYHHRPSDVGTYSYPAAGDPRPHGGQRRSGGM